MFACLWRSAAAHLAGSTAAAGADYDGDVAAHYARAVKMLPSLAAHHVLGTLGTYSFGPDARLAIQTRLSQLHTAQTLAQRTHPVACRWHRWMERYLVRGLEAHGLGERTCKERVWLFCRLRGQTPGSADMSWGPSSILRGVGGSEEAAVYLSRELTRLGYCVRVYGNPTPEEYGLGLSTVCLVMI